RAGCRTLYLGLETYNDRLLKKLKKGINTRLVDQVLSNASWAGLPVAAYMMVGLPSETEAEARNTHEHIERFKSRRLIDSYTYNLFKILPGSNIANCPEKYGITRLTKPAGLDLDPPIIRFEGAGMVREAVISLGLYQPREVESLIGTRDTVVAQGKTIPLRYDLNRIAALLRHNYTARVLNCLPFGKWLDRTGNAVWKEGRITP
ncbi:MAG: hypothetical protein JRL30_12025, partial [Deltaproteobacteria bacterium]|nr:hypothetical protein [Deltaproteobacteria bacterium]